jgi:uncharacterized RDD family membrane protein YckC
MTTPETAPLWLRFAAIFYDFLILLAIWMFAAALVLLAFKGEVDVAHQPPLYHAVLQTTLFTLTTMYFVTSWCRGGQTVGMRAWRVRVVDENGQLPTLKSALLRYFTAIGSWFALGAGFLWSLIDQRRRGWHDIASKTLLVRVPKR